MSEIADKKTSSPDLDKHKNKSDLEETTIINSDSKVIETSSDKKVTFPLSIK